MKIAVLGPGCPRCERLIKNVQQAVKKLGIEAEVEKIVDLEKIQSHGLMMTPGLVVDGKLRSAGMVLSEEQIVELLTREESRSRGS